MKTDKKFLIIFIIFISVAWNPQHILLDRNMCVQLNDKNLYAAGLSLIEQQNLHNLDDVEALTLQVGKWVF